MTAPTIIAGLKQTLLPYVPFSKMAVEDLDFLLENIRVAYFAPGETVLAPSGEVPTTCFIVKQGRVLGLVNKAQPNEIASETYAGDCFPVGALLAQRPCQLTYVAASDTFAFLLPRARFDDLVKRSATFLDFCKRRLGHLLDLSNQQLQAAYAAQANAEHTLNTPLRDLVRGEPVTCTPDTPLRAALTRMHEARVGSIVVVRDGETQQIAGILTLTDLIGRVILPEVKLDQPISAVMSANVLALDANATAADATLLMAQHAIRHVPVRETSGARARLIGVVSERNLFALQRLSVRQLSAAIRQATDPASLAVVAEDIRRLSLHLVAQGVASRQLTNLISHLNDQLGVRLLALASEKFSQPANSFCWLALGSEGRSEQTIATDQDNGIVFAEGASRDALLELADWVNQGLARCGFPLCKGNIMARNSQWCLSTQQWTDLFLDWINRGDPEALLNASIFFDFRGLHGNLSLAQQMRQVVVDSAPRNTRFLKQMADNALRNRAPSGGLGGGLLDELLGDSAGEPVDLKMRGTVPFVDAARIWALGAGLTETNTTERLLRLADSDRMPRSDIDSWIDAFEFLQLMRLRVQHQRAQTFNAAEADQGNPNVIDPRHLSALDRRILKEAFRQARKLQQRLELDFPG